MKLQENKVIVCRPSGWSSYVIDKSKDIFLAVDGKHKIERGAVSIKRLILNTPWMLHSCSFLELQINVSDIILFALYML